MLTLLVHWRQVEQGVEVEGVSQQPVPERGDPSLAALKSAISGGAYIICYQRAQGNAAYCQMNGKAQAVHTLQQAVLMSLHSLRNH